MAFFTKNGTAIGPSVSDTVSAVKFLFRIFTKLCIRICYKKLSGKRQFLENPMSDSHTLREETHVYPSFPYLLIDLGKFRYNAAKKL
jgi:hypothetical protein